jgi:hypothetical protein
MAFFPLGPFVKKVDQTPQNSNLFKSHFHATQIMYNLQKSKDFSNFQLNNQFSPICLVGKNVVGWNEDLS